MTRRERKLFTALKLAHEHLEWCGYGDRFEREVARDNRLPERLTKVIDDFEKEKRA